MKAWQLPHTSLLLSSSSRAQAVPPLTGWRCQDSEDTENQGERQKGQLGCPDPSPSPARG